MQIFYDFLPVIAFFVAYKMYDIYIATAVIMVAIGLQILIYWIWKRTVSRMHIISAILVFGLGGITLVLRNEIFIQWKPTLVNWLFGLAFLGSQFIGEKPIIQRMLPDDLGMSESVLRKLNLMWAMFFFFSGAANIVAVYTLSENGWVNFKLFGMLGLTLVFILIQGVWIAKQMPPEKTAEKTGEAAAEDQPTP